MSFDEQTMGARGAQNREPESLSDGIKFTVVIPTYNYAHLLPDALRALAAQTVRDFELLIVDDGSADNTQEVVEQFRPRLQNCRYIKKPHGGLPDTRNYGAQRAQGTHIAFLDADDVWSPRYLEAVRNKFVSNPRTEIVFCNGFRIRNDGRVIRQLFPPRLAPLDGPVSSAEALFSLCNYFIPTGMVFLKSLYDQIGPFDVRFRPGDDVGWVIRAAMSGAYCTRVDRTLLLYRIHGGNMTNNPIPFLDAWLKIYEEQLRRSRLGPECERRARNFTRDYVLRLLGICSPSEGRALLSKTLKALNEDSILTCAYVSTYLGSTYAMRPLKWGKQLIQKRHANTQWIDLNAPPEIMFQGL